MVVRRATMEDYQEDAEAVAAAAATARAAARAASGDPAAATGEGGSPGDGVVSGGGVGDHVMRYARVLLVAAVVGFKIVEWWTRIEAQVKNEGSSTAVSGDLVMA